MTNVNNTVTGFLFSFVDTNGFLPVVVTCWHVVANSGGGHFLVSLTTTNYKGRIDFVFHAGDWIRHPDTNIDLAVLPFAAFVDQVARNQLSPDIMPITDKLVATKMEDFGVFQEIKFIGYPIGAWDEKHNLPIVRRGMTATDPGVDYNGMPKFLIDAAVYPGSSGSPIFVAEEGGCVWGETAVSIPEVI